MQAELIPALLAGLLWALSAPVISIGLGRVRAVPGNRLPLLVYGLTAALIAGFLAIWTGSGFANPLSQTAWPILLGGILTFPVGTGLYYICSAAYGDRAAMASQFANVKPLISIAAGALLFGEVAGASDFAVVAMILAGVGIMFVAALRRSGAIVPIALGLALAVAWSGGEILVRLATDGATTIQITLGALFGSLLVTLPLTALTLVLHGHRNQAVGRRMLSVLTPFCVHGLLSFGLAYYFFFQSIGQIGLARTIMITVWWPALALVIDVALRALRGKPVTMPVGTLLGLSLFTLAAATHIVAG